MSIMGILTVISLILSIASLVLAGFAIKFSLESKEILSKIDIKVRRLTP